MSPERPVLHGARVVLRPPAPADAEPLTAILAEPSVVRRWREHDLEQVRTDLLGEGIGWVIEVDAAVRGWIQAEEETDPDYRHVSVDLFLSEAVQDQGLGREAIRTVVEHFVALGHHRFTIDPAADNEQAIRAYRAVGFRVVGVLREYERDSDGTWHDGLLMDLLARELPR
jgi:aminoglycoside 6'-N-acetyltransferase